jgi:hypothetical protein
MDQALAVRPRATYIGSAEFARMNPAEVARKAKLLRSVNLEPD